MQGPGMDPAQSSIRRDGGRTRSTDTRIRILRACARRASPVYNARARSRARTGAEPAVTVLLLRGRQEDPTAGGRTGGREAAL